MSVFNVYLLTLKKKDEACEPANNLNLAVFGKAEYTVIYVPATCICICTCFDCEDDSG